MMFQQVTNLVRAAAIIVAVSAPLVVDAQPDRNRQVRRQVDVRQRIDSTFAFSKTGELRISLRSGEVRVTGWARNDARVVAVTEQGTVNLLATQNQIRIEMRPPGMSRARFEISVPIGVRVIAETRAADIDVSGTQGPMSLTSISGEINASDGAGQSRIETAAGVINAQRFSGETRVRSMTGPISIDEITGDLTLTTVTAPAEVERADLSNLTVDAAQGSFDFAGRLGAQGKHRIETFGGSVELRLPPDFGAVIDMESISGKLHAPDFPVTMKPRGQALNSERQQYTINGGGVLINISTFNGGVTLRRLAASNRR
jgi:DUF4097 and DUF4098 domain-containing protein YvlB